MSIEDITEINIFYNPNKEDEIYKEYEEKEEFDKNIKIFGFDFVKNNKDKCKMIIDNKEYEIEAIYHIGKYNKHKKKN